MTRYGWGTALMRRAGDLAYYRAYGPPGAALATPVRVAGARWAIEEAIELAWSAWCRRHQARARR